MKILFFSRLFYPHIGGVEKHVLEVGRELIARGHEVTVVTEQYDTDLAQKDYIDTIQIYRIPVGGSYWFKKFRIWWWLLKNRQLMSHTDIIHCHDVFFWFLPFRFFFPRKPVYTTFHGYEGRFPPSQKAILIRRLSAVLSKGNICVGDYIKKWYGTKPTFLTYGGINEVQSSKFKVKSYSAPQKRLTGRSILKILFIGRLEKDTGIKTYLGAIKLLKKKKIPFTFEACGDGELREKVEKFGKVHGFVKDIGPYLDGADIIFTSSYLTILEAIAHEKIVIAVYDNLLKEDYLRMAPFADTIVIASNTRVIYENVVFLSKEPKIRENFTDKGYRWVQNESWEKVANIYQKLWNL